MNGVNGVWTPWYTVIGNTASCDHSGKLSGDIWII